MTLLSDTKASPAHHLREAGEGIIALMELITLIEMSAGVLAENERCAIRQGLEQVTRMASNVSESIMWASAPNQEGMACQP